MRYSDPNQVISMIYDAVLEENDWGAALSSLLSFTNFEMGCIELVDYAASDFRILAHQGYPDTLYVAPPDIDWVKADLWGNAVQPEQRNDIMVGSHIVDPKEYLKSEFYGAAKSVDLPIHDVLASTVSIGNWALSTVALYRRDNQELVSEADIKKYSVLHDHVRRALNLSYCLSDLRSSLKVHKELSDSLPYAVFGISADKCTIAKNRSADVMLHKGSPVYIKGSHIRAVWDEDNVKLQNAIQKAIGVYFAPDHNPKVEASSFLIHCENSNRPWSVLIFPVSPNFDAAEQIVTNGGIRAMVCISNPFTVTDPRVRHIALAYLLTEAEEALISAMTKGASISEIAKLTGRSVETLRSQLKSVFAKTNCRSQTDLSKLILIAPPAP